MTSVWIWREAKQGISDGYREPYDGEDSELDV